MQVQTTINECVEMLSESFGNELIFDTPVIVKKTPHQELFRCFGASTKYHRLALMDVNGEWYEVDSSQVDVQYVVNSVYQRLKLMAYERV